MSIRVEFHPEADKETDEVADWYEARRPGLGADFSDKLDEAQEAIAANPRAWAEWPSRRAKQLGVRRYVMQGFPFTLPFIVREELITVLAVAHTSRRPGYWLERARP